MAYEIIFSDEVFEKLNLIILYLEETWSKQVAENFLLIFYKRVDDIVFNPKLGIITEKNKFIRKTIITKHNTLYYEISGERV